MNDEIARERKIWTATEKQPRLVIAFSYLLSTFCTTTVHR